jgi:hypothetical protein
MRRHTCLTVLLVGCGSTSVAPIVGPPAQGLIVHEWGTYTSVQSSDGRSMQGLQHTEEALPDFVHMRGPNPTQKGVETLPSPVTQKLETPVLYFYGAPNTDFKAHVDFPQGVVSEWYPAATSFEPPVGGLKAILQGSIDWAGTLSPPGASSLPSVPADSVWAPSRAVSATPLRVAGEDENFIFYRGLGQFDMPVRALSAADGSLSIANGSNDTISAAFLLRIEGGMAGVLALGPIASQATTMIPALPGLVSMAQYESDAKTSVQAALVASGLYPDEAHAMVETWSRSYFEMPGVRLLYVAPRAWTDGLLPLSISPAPSELVRTLVGRIEVLTQAEETQILFEIQAAAGQPSDLLASLGRFAEPKLRRALELIQDPMQRDFVNTMLLAAAQAP